MGAGEIFAIVCSSIIFVCLLVFLIMLPKKVYFMLLVSGAHISAFTLIGMKLRKEKLDEIASAYVLSKKSNLGLSLIEIEHISISGGHPVNVVAGLNAAKLANLKIDFRFAKSVDIAGIDFLNVVRECVNPKVIELPLITATCKDSVEVNVKISLSLKVNVKNFMTGVNDETISARAVEAVVTKIANTARAGDLVSRPELLDKAIFDANVDDDSKYMLVSADVVHIDKGRDNSFEVERQEIEKQKLLNESKLEERRLLAVAIEQEMKAKTEEMKSKAAASEAEIQKKIAQAIEDGKVQDLLDYYKLENLQADTEMRRRMGLPKEEEGE